MRVAVRHTDKKHPNAGWFAFGEGRLQGFRNPMTQEAFTAEQMAEALLEEAKRQFPEADGYEHRVETLHAAGRDERGEIGEWHPLGKSELPRAGFGETQSAEVVAEQASAAQTKKEG